MIAKNVKAITELLIAESSASSREWWTNYVKESSPFLGTPTPAIRKIVNRFIDPGDASIQAIEAATKLGFALLERSYSEEKIAGMLILKEYVIPLSAEVPPMLQAERIVFLFDEGYIFDWNICDWFCMRVTGPLIRAYGDSVGSPILDWVSAYNLWRARASVVSFIPVIETGTYHGSILKAAKHLNRRSERFAKTGVGWVLREMSKYDPFRVAEFVEDDLGQFSIESLRNATKYCEGQDQRSLIDRFRILTKQ